MGNVCVAAGSPLFVELHFSLIRAIAFLAGKVLLRKGEEGRIKVQPSYRDFCFLSALLRDRLVKLKDTSISVCTINP